MDRATLAEVAKGLPVSKQEMSAGFIGGKVFKIIIFRDYAPSTCCAEADNLTKHENHCAR